MTSRGSRALHREAHFIENAWYKVEWGDEFLFVILSIEWG